MFRLKTLFKQPWQKSQITHQPIMSQFDITSYGLEMMQLDTTLHAPIEKSESQKLGEINSPFFGSGLTYEESRRYQSGDEVRKLDWRLMVKTGQAFTKLYEEEKQGETLLLVDQRRSMRFGSQNQLKVTQAIKVAGYFAWLSLQRQMPVSAIRFDDSPHFSETFEGANTFDEIMHFLSVPCPPYEPENEMGHLNSVIKEVLLHLSSSQKGKRSGIKLVLVSDMRGFDDQTLLLLAELKMQAWVKVIMIQDVIEQTLPSHSMVEIEGEALSVRVAEDYQRWVESATKTTQKKLHSIGIKMTLITAQADLREWLLQVQQGVRG